ncbi:MAG: hypothetical protein U0573_05560 [Phycisphaerales bacterium]|nr:hypothetical protein [Planctomycetota bacterium]
MSTDPGLTPAESRSLLDQPQKSRPKGKRILFSVLGGILLLVVVLVVLAPTIAGSFIRGTRVISSPQVRGNIDSASLGWLGGQTVNIALTDSQGKPSGKLQIAIDRGLLGLAGNWYNLGTIKVTGDVELRENAGDAKPATPPGHSSTTQVSVTTDSIPIPKGLEVKIDVALSRVSLLDKAQNPVAELKDVKVNGDIRAGSPITLDMAAKSGGAPLAAKIKIENWTDSAGVLHLDSASLAKNSPKLNASISAEELSVALLDAVLAAATGQESNLQALLGNKLSVHASAAGDYSGGSASLNATSPGATVLAKLALNSGTLTLSEPATATLQSAAVQAVLDRHTSPDQMGGLTITQAPTATVRIDKLSLKLPTAGLDLRGAALDASAELDRIAGKLALGEGQPQSEVEIPAFKASLRSDDLGAKARLTANAASSITTNGQSASGGDLFADITVAGLLDAAGAPLGLPKTIDGKVSLHGASTGILQPIVAAALSSSGVALDLPRDIGPVADIDLLAKSEAGAIDLDFSAKSQGADAAALLRITDDALTTREGGLKARISNAGQIVARTLRKAGGAATATPSGQITLSAQSVSLPFAKGTRNPELDKMAAVAQAELSGWNLAVALPPGKDQQPGTPVALDLRTLRIDASIDPKAGAGGKLSADATANGSAVRADGEFSLPNLRSAFSGEKPAAPNALAKLLGAFYPIAKINVTGLPGSLADALPRSAGAVSPVTALVREGLGEVFDISFESGPGKSADRAALRAAVSGARAKLALNGDFAASSMTVSADGSGTITPSLLDALIAGNAADKPRLQAPASYTFAADPIEIPLKSDGSPDLDRAGIAKARLSLPGQTMVRAGSQGGGVRDLTVNASIPVSTLGNGNGGEGDVKVGSGLLSADGSAMGSLAARANGPLGPGLTLTGPAGVEVRLGDLQTAGLDKALNQPGLVSGALGPTAELIATTNIVPTGKATKIAEAVSNTDLAADITLTTQRLEIKRPLKARMLPDRISLESPDAIHWTIEPAWFDRFVLGKQPGVQGTDLSLMAPAKAELVLSKAVISRPEPEKGIEGPAYPSIFSLDATAKLESMELVDARKVRTQVGDAVVKIRTLDTPAGQGTPLGFSISFAKLAVVPDPGKSGPGGGELSGTIANISNAKGKIDTANPTLTVKGDIKTLPSALIDAFSLKNGLPGDILGPSVNISLDAQNFSKTGGSLALSARSTETGQVTENGKTATRPRAEVTLKGTSQGGVYTTPISLTLRKIDDALAARITSVYPDIAEVEKTFSERPTVVTSPQFGIPLDGDLRKLNGAVTIDPGDARFKISSNIGTFLKVFQTKQQGKLLQRLEPVTVTARSGVLTYPRWKFPVGTFSIETEGTVDLPGDRLDIITWVPLGELADSAMGLFKNIPGLSALSKSTMMPLRTRGTLSKHTTLPDGELALKNTIKSVPNTAVDVLKDLIKKPK